MLDYNLKESIGYLSNKIHGLLKALLNREFKDAGYHLTSGHLSILVVISQNPEATQNTIALKALRDKTNVTRIIDSLQKQKIVERKADKTDRRAHRISITANGITTIKQLTPIVVKINKIAEQGTNEEKLDITKKTLTQILANIIP